MLFEFKLNLIVKCPDCNTRLTEIKIEGDAWVFRCFKCGGFWMDSWTVNRMTSKVLSQWRRIGLSEMWRGGGKGVCPQDGMMLQRYRGESMPPMLAVSRCARCGKWWFPGDTLFSYKPAVEAKISYFQQWGLTGDLNGLALPIISIAVMITTLGLAVNYSRMQQETAVQADLGIRHMAIAYLGDGKAMVSFSSQQAVKQVAYRLRSSKNWTIVLTEKEGDLYKAIASDLVVGETYVFKAGEKETEYTIK